MATFVHITRDVSLPAIRRSGIAMSRLWAGSVPNRGVFCVPVVPDFFVTHQWMHELRRFGGQMRMGVYFRIPDDQIVHAGRYNYEPAPMTAAEAVALARTADHGFQVIVPRAIAKREITRIKNLPQVTGWRVHPEAKGTKPMWFTPGSWGGRKRQATIDDARAQEEAQYYSRFPAEWYADADADID